MAAAVAVVAAVSRDRITLANTFRDALEDLVVRPLQVGEADVFAFLGRGNGLFERLGSSHCTNLSL